MLESLGVNFPSIIFYLISFLISLYVLNNFVFKRVAKIMDEREISIAESLKMRDEARNRITHLEEESAEIIAKARGEMKTILEEARIQAEPEKQNVIRLATEQGENIIAAAHARSNEIIDSAKSEATVQSVQILEKILDKAMTNLNLSPEIRAQVNSQIIAGVK